MRATLKSRVLVLWRRDRDTVLYLREPQTTAQRDEDRRLGLVDVGDPAQAKTFSHRADIAEWAARRSAYERGLFVERGYKIAVVDLAVALTEDCVATPTPQFAGAKS